MVDILPFIVGFYKHHYIVKKNMFKIYVCILNLLNCVKGVKVCCTKFNLLSHGVAMCYLCMHKPFV